MAPKSTGLIGHPVSHSLSPAIHAHWIKDLKISASYERYDVPPETLKETIHKFREQKMAGFNVTIPHKQNIIAELDSIDKIARKIGAVNTVMRVDDLLIGTNTDAYGFVTHLKQSAPKLELTKVVILGAGGATRAAIVGLKEAGAKDIVLLNRTEDKAKILADTFGVSHVDWDQREEMLRDTTLLVNTTSLGMKGAEPLELSLDALPRTACVYDIVYAPLETELLKTARARGNQTIDGLGMLLHQAAAAFRLWHGAEAAVTDALREKILKIL